MCRFGVTDKEGLAQTYLRSDLGFVLRDDVAVNRVSCPTKLSEYLWFGVVPVVKSPAIGDFERLGFEYVKAEELAIGMLPDEPAMERMRATNRAVIEELAGLYESAAEQLNALILPNRIAGSGTAGLPVGWRHLTFPNQAELYLFDKATVYRPIALQGVYDELVWKYDPPEPAQTCRFVALLADVRLQIEEIELTLAPGEQLNGTLAASTPGTVCRSEPGHAALLALPRATPYVDLAFGARVLIAEARVRVRFEAAGIDAIGPPGAQASGDAFIAVVINNGSGLLERIDAPLRTTCPGSRCWRAPAEPHRNRADWFGWRVECGQGRCAQS